MGVAIACESLPYVRTFLIMRVFFVLGTLVIGVPFSF